MAFSHRDHRARRELRRLYLVFGGVLGVLALIAILFPDNTVRILAVVGLALAGTAYVLSVDRLSERYQRDLAACRSGTPISGSIRAEVYHEIGFERDRVDDWTPSPHTRHVDISEELTSPVAPPTSAVPTLPGRLDQP
jgi:hypothetical protein